MLFLWWWQLRFRLRLFASSVIVAYSTCIYAHIQQQSIPHTHATPTRASVYGPLACQWYLPSYSATLFKYSFGLSPASQPAAWLGFPLSLLGGEQPARARAWARARLNENGNEYEHEHCKCKCQIIGCSEIHTNSIHFKCTWRQLVNWNSARVCCMLCTWGRRCVARRFDLLPFNLICSLCFYSRSATE